MKHRYRGIRRTLQLAAAASVAAFTLPVAAQGPVSRPGGGSTSETKASESDERPAEKEDEESEGVSPTAEAESGGESQSGPEAGEASETNEESEGDESVANPTAYCDGYMLTHGESSARKLYRALAGENYGFRKIDLEGPIELDVSTSDGTRSVAFEVRLQNERRSVVLVSRERAHRRTVVAAWTAGGAVVVEVRWPERAEIDSKSDCKPTGARILSPKVETNKVEIEPFDYLGIRILWNIPDSFRNGEPELSSMEAALRGVVGASEE